MSQSTHHPPLFHVVNLYSSWRNLLSLECSFRVAHNISQSITVPISEDITKTWNHKVWCYKNLVFNSWIYQKHLARGNFACWCLIEIKLCANHGETLVCKFPDSAKDMICVCITLCAANRATSNFCSIEPQYWTDHLPSEYKIPLGLFPSHFLDHITIQKQIVLGGCLGLV